MLKLEMFKGGFIQTLEGALRREYVAGGVVRIGEFAVGVAHPGGKTQASLSHLVGSLSVIASRDALAGQHRFDKMNRFVKADGHPLVELHGLLEGFAVR